MALVAKYTKLLQKLLPQGDAWPRNEHAELTKFLSAIGIELSNIELRALDLLEEADPRTSTELLEDWERITGFPDECVGELESISARRRAVVARLTQRGGQSPGFFIGLAAVLGFTITITEFGPALCGIAECGDAMAGELWLHWWQVNAPLNTITYAECGTAKCGDPISFWGNTLLECAILRAKPAHTNVIFSYS